MEKWQESTEVKNYRDTHSCGVLYSVLCLQKSTPRDMAVLNIVIEAFLHSVEFQYHEIKKPSKMLY